MIENRCEIAVHGSHLCRMYFLLLIAVRIARISPLLCFRSLHQELALPSHHNMVNLAISCRQGVFGGIHLHFKKQKLREAGAKVQPQP
jgi:hypothetical protein